MNAPGSYFRTTTRLIFLLTLIGAGLFFLYQLSVTANEAKITRRSYGFLSATSHQLASQVDALVKSVPQLDSSNADKPQCTPAEKMGAITAGLNTATVSFTSSEDKLRLELEVSNKDPNKKVAVVCGNDFGENIKSAALKQTFFDLMMLAEGPQAKILYDVSSSGALHVAGISKLTDLVKAEGRFETEGTGGTGLLSLVKLNPGTPNPLKDSRDSDWLGPGQYERVRYLANEYILFSVAVPMPSSSNGPTYALVGLVQAERFSAEATALPIAWKIWTPIIVILILLLLSIFGVLSKGIRERLRVVNVLILAFFVLAASMISMMIVLLIDLQWTTASFFDDLTKTLGDEVALRFETELVEASKLL